jgi:hypothetical protein
VRRFLHAMGNSSSSTFFCRNRADASVETPSGGLRSGDIHPSSGSSLAKLVVMTEIMIGFVYAVFVFSVLATFIKESQST